MSNKLKWDASILPYGRQWVDADDVAAVKEALQSNSLSDGPEITAFEDALAEATGSRFAIAVSSGTAALHLAALGLNLEAAEHVVVPAITFLATASAVRYAGVEVVFSDVDPDTGLMNELHLEAAVAGATGPVRGVFNVHLNGQCGDLPAIEQVARRHGLYVVDDACHAIGASYGEETEQPVGSCRHCDASVFSFHPVKTVTMGEGGAVTTNDQELRERIVFLRSHGVIRDPAAFVSHSQAFAESGEPNPWYYEMQELGFNYRASEINCVLGRSQLRKLARFVETRRALAARYRDVLQPFAPLVRPIAATTGCQPAWHLYPVQIDFHQVGRSRAEIMNGLRRRGIGSQVHYIPVYRHPYYRERYGEISLPGAERYYARTLSLPIFPAMDLRDVDRVVEALCAELRI